MRVSHCLRAQACGLNSRQYCAVSNKSQFTKAEEDLSALKEKVRSACQQATASVTFQELSREESSMQQEIGYRRKVVFSQAVCDSVLCTALGFCIWFSFLFGICSLEFRVFFLLFG